MICKINIRRRGRINIRIRGIESKRRGQSERESYKIGHKKIKSIVWSKSWIRGQRESHRRGHMVCWKGY